MRKNDLYESANFLADYAAWLISVGSYSARAHKCVTRIANAWGYDVVLSILLVNVTITLIDKNNYNDRRTFIKPITHKGINLRKLSDLSSLSWEVADRNLDINQAKRYFSIITNHENKNFISSILITSAAFGAFCHIFGGDLWGMIFVILGTFCGVVLRQILTAKNADIRLIYLICAFLSSCIAYLGCVFNLSLTPTATLSSSILYLVPGIIVINSIFDILNQNTLIGIARLVNAIILFLCMASGIYITLSIFGVNIQ